MAGRGPKLSVTDHEVVDSEQSTTSLPYAGLNYRPSFKSKDLKRFLAIITEQIDLSAVALKLYSNEVIEMSTAQDILQFSGTGEREKSLKVLEIYSQLQKQEDRVPFFFRSLLDSGDSSPTNRQLYETLSQELDFSDSDVDEACKNEDFKRRSLSKKKVMKRRTGSASSGIETAQSSTSSIRNVSPSPSHMSDGTYRHASLDSPGSSSADALITYLQQENVRLHREVARLNQQLEWSNRLLTEAEKKLENVQSQPKLSCQFDHNPLYTRSRRISSHARILPPSESRIRKVSRSLDDIHHELIRLELEHQTIAEMMEPGHAELSTVKFNQKSSRLHAKTTKGHK